MGRDASPGVTQDVAYQARRATQAEPIPETGEEDPFQVHSQYDHGSGNVINALGPGDMIITAVSIGARLTSGTLAKPCTCPSPNTHGQ